MLSKIKKRIYGILVKCEKGYNTMVCITIVSLMLTVTTSAAGTPVLVTGTLSLFQAATTWLLLIIPVGGGLFLGYHALMKALTDDQAVIADKNKLMKNVLIGLAIAETASGLVTVILSFYK